MRISLEHGDALPPKKATDGSSAYDLYAYLLELGEVVIGSGCYAKIPTGVHMEIPVGQVGLVFTRSGNGATKGIKIRNQTGVIDADYRGEIFVTLENRGSLPFTVKHQDRFAQILFTHAIHHEFEVVESLTETDRGEGGHGSTGK